MQQWLLCRVERKKDLYELDLSKGLTAGTTYDGGISVLETMSFKSGSASLDGVKYTGCVQGDNSPNPNKGKIPTSGAAVKLEAEKRWQNQSCI